MRVLGVDACRAGWVGIELGDGRFAGARFAAGLSELLDTSLAVVGVDIPLGLLDRGWRRADIEAARLLGPRRSSVFRAAPRAVWDEPDYGAANRICRELTGQGLSRQAWGLAAKLREANELRDDRVHEVHPELSFRTMAGAPLAHSKNTWAGQARRRELLATAGVLLPSDLGPANLVSPVDVLDAAAAAWSAHRIGAGRAASIPSPPERDSAGRPVAIWY